jgi:hypothetical protein
MYLATKKHIGRRAFLRGSGTLLALPLLEAMLPAFATHTQATQVQRLPQRFVAIGATLGFHTPFLFPKETGADYQMTPYLGPLKDLRNDFTVISGLQHDDQTGVNGHASEMTWLTSAKHPGLAGFKNTISIDQRIAQEVGPATRFPSLVLSTTKQSLSWSASGVMIPPEDSPSRAFKQLFVEGSKEEVEAQIEALKRGRSILDTVLGEAKKMRRELGYNDSEKLDEYLTAVREVEERIQQNEIWSKKPKPKVNHPVPVDIQKRTDALGKMKLMQDLVLLALKTDSTRTVTLRLEGLTSVPEIDGVESEWHNLSHHGQDEAKIAELKLIELAEFRTFAAFLQQLQSLKEQGRSLLDSTTVLFGSNLGNASSHRATNLPIIVAGGGYKHGRHIKINPEQQVFSNLFVSIAQRVGLAIEQFGYSTGNLDLNQV